MNICLHAYLHVAFLFVTLICTTLESHGEFIFSAWLHILVHGAKATEEKLSPFPNTKRRNVPAYVLSLLFPSRQREIGVPSLVSGKYLPHWFESYPLWHLPKSSLSLLSSLFQIFNLFSCSLGTYEQYLSMCEFYSILKTRQNKTGNHRQPYFWFHILLWFLPVSFLPLTDKFLSCQHILSPFSCVTD